MGTGAGYATGPDVRRAAFPARARQPENIAERERRGVSPRSLSVLRAPATPLRRRCAPQPGPTVPPKPRRKPARDRPAYCSASASFRRTRSRFHRPAASCGFGTEPHVRIGPFPCVCGLLNLSARTRVASLPTRRLSPATILDSPARYPSPDRRIPHSPGIFRGADGEGRTGRPALAREDRTVPCAPPA